MQYTARHLQTVAEKCILVQQWLKSCIREHGPACSGSHSSVVQQQQHVWDIPNFVLIDVHKHCLIDAPMRCRYAALSYVWGHQPFFNLTKLNVSRLRQPRSLKNHRTLTPKTIYDAIHFVRQIREHFL
jgi:hypothetical protein